MNRCVPIRPDPAHPATVTQLEPGPQLELGSSCQWGSADPQLQTRSMCSCSQVKTPRPATTR
eukprot:3101072-Rhodomonas_salina.1